MHLVGVTNPRPQVYLHRVYLFALLMLFANCTWIKLLIIIVQRYRRTAVRISRPPPHLNVSSYRYAFLPNKRHWCVILLIMKQLLESDAESTVGCFRLTLIPSRLRAPHLGKQRRQLSYILTRWQFLQFWFF